MENILALSAKGAATANGPSSPPNSILFHAWVAAPLPMPAVRTYGFLFASSRAAKSPQAGALQVPGGAAVRRGLLLEGFADFGEAFGDLVPAAGAGGEFS